MKRRTLTFPALLTLMLAAAVPPVIAQTANEDADGPGRGVARLSLMNGEVSVRRGDSGDWVAAAINAPLMTEDRVFSGPRSRAEVQFDYYHRVRLAEDTEVRLSDIENGRYLIQLARGTATFSALKGGDAQVEISTPAAAVRPVAYGSYRITVGPDGAAEITVRSGEVEIYTPSGTQRLKSGRTMLVRNGEDGAPVFQMVAAIGKDDWDRFNDARDKELRRGLQTYQYVSRDIYGAEDLYGNGDWVDVAPYGRVWRPYVAIGWAPYRYGRWSWVDYYGWSWVSYDPWGWAPYHYGRWFNHGGRWCWYPGANRGGRHHWSPGLVAWFGWGHGGVGIGMGGGWGRMGWVPLAPYDPFHRWWGRNSYQGYRNGRGYNNLTVVNNVNITNVYRNARVTNAISMHDGDFSRGMRGQAFRGNSAELGRASVMRGGVPVTPQRESLRFADRDARAMPAARSGAAGNERFYSRTAARSVERVPFDRQREAMQSAERRTGNDVRRGGDAIETSRGGNVRGGVENGAGRTDGNRNARTAEESRGGWRTAGEPATTRGGGANVDAGRTAAPRSGEAGGATTRGGWRSFGNPAGGRTTSGEAAGARTGGEASGARTGRSADAVRGGEAANSDSRGAWRGFGDPGRGSRSESTVRTGDATEGSRSGSPARSAEGATSGGRGTWSTRGGDRGAARSVDTGRTQSGRGSETRSTRGGGSDRGSAPARVESQRSDTPRSETRSAEPARSSPPARSASPSRTESPRTGGRGNNDMAGARTSAPVSTGSGFVSGGSSQRWSTRSSDMGQASSSRSVGSTGGGSRAMSESRSTGRGNWSTGGGETSSRSMSSGRSQSYSGDSGMSSSRSMPSTRSMESSRSYGGSSRSSGGGGGMSAPSVGSRSSGGSGGGGGIRSSGGGGMSSGGGMSGGGGVRSSSGGGRSGGGGGRSSGGGGGRSGGGGGRR